MKYLPLILAGLWRKPMRTVFTFLSIVVAFILFGILGGMDDGFAHVQAAARIDRLFVDPRFAGRLPIAYQNQIAAIPGVTVVAPRMGLPGYYRTRQDSGGIIMTDSSFFAARPELTATKAQMEAFDRDPTALIVTVFAANKYGWKVGDTVPWISNVATKDGSQTWTFHILAIIDNSDSPGTSNFWLGNYTYLDQRRLREQGLVDRFLLIIRDPAQSVAIGRQIDKLFANSPQPTRTESEKVQFEAGLRSLGDINFFTQMIVACLLFMLLFLTGNTMMQSVRERIPEFAVLKTLGFSDSGVLALVVGESVILCLLAGAVGLGIIQLLGRYYYLFFPGMAGFFLMTWSAFFTGMGFALLTAFLSGAIPAWRAKRLNVVDALAGR
ncbi:MAG TPA: ABC transporter permease [Rhizomicrobium sp.]|nr:ABC transporter permease [Rhizomicrobium sp.]